MSRVRTPDEFVARVREARGRYVEEARKILVEVRAQYGAAAKEERPTDDEVAKEAHVRAFLIDTILSALNWGMGARRSQDMGEVVPEATVRSVEKENEKFNVKHLDYLGLEGSPRAALLVVETKHPADELPGLADASEESEPIRDVAEIIIRGLKGKRLTGEWTKWLATLRNYIRSLSRHGECTTRRVMVTNGEWFVVFTEPEQAFIQDCTCDASSIFVYQEFNDLLAEYVNVFRLLEHARVARLVPPLRPAELAFSSETFQTAVHALRVLYVNQPGIHRDAPSIKVSPTLFLLSKAGQWIPVEDPQQDFELPAHIADLPKHLSDVSDAAGRLLESVTKSLGNSVELISLEDFFSDENRFERMKAISVDPWYRRTPHEAFVVVTGSATHYLRLQASIPNCAWHAWSAASAKGHASGPQPILMRRTDPRSFFPTDTTQHCAHRDTHAAKSTLISGGTQGKMGLRSGSEGQAFCEIWRFEEYLCCRTCAFESVCTKASGFKLPCP